jgi:peptidoglycan/xylan/chitin deacetylase (PgdA/CDA1 family)
LAGGARQLAELPIARMLRPLTAGMRNLLHVVTYHRIDSPAARLDLSPATLSATPDDFAAQMERVQGEFCPVSIDQVCDAIARQRDLPPRAVLITFDDAYCDFRDHAWPVLRKLQIPAVVFVPTGFADDSRRRFWWDQLHAALRHAPDGAQVDTSLGRVQLLGEAQRKSFTRQLTEKLSSLDHRAALAEVDRIADALAPPAARRDVLNWQELRQLADEGVAFAPHTRSHPLMDRIPLEEARREVVGSRDDLQQHLGSCPPVFAYPGGAYDEHVKAMLAEEGFQAAFTTRRGANVLARSDALALRRINVGLRTTSALLAAQLELPPSLYNACC